MLEQVASIRELLKRKSKEEILADLWLIRGLKYSLQTSVEAIIDVSYHVAAKVYGYAPKDARDAVHCLVDRGILSQDNEVIYSSMIGFRNRVVHGYQEISAERVYEIADKELDDLLNFVRDINSFVEKL
ncbi:MAG: DUF86 domain-containing protein [Syntrophothermus sp.]|nr:DUF86 domain-containing protein [Syntrophothermus sp.]